MVSTVASGDTRPYVGAVDVTMMYSVVDIAGVNRVSARIMANAAGAIAGMARRDACRPLDEKPLVGATMFGVTTPCVTRARERLEELGYEVLVFHATGAGGQSMEALATRRLPRRRARRDDDRARRRARRRRPLGRARPARGRGRGRACRRSSRSARSTWSTSARARRCPQQFDGRNLYVHNPTVTLMRTTPEECAELGRQIGRKLSAATGPTALFVPLRGVSMIAGRGPAVPRRRGRRRRCSRGCTRRSARASRCTSVDADINDPAFATAMADRLHELIQEAGDDARRGARAPARAGRGGQADHRRRRRHGPLGEARRGRRRRPDHHLQLAAATGWAAAARSRACCRTATRTRSSSTWRARCCRSSQDTPVLAGVCGTDPFRLMPVFLDELKRIGFSGVQNFPTVGLIDGTLPHGLEETGMGYGLEVDMIRLAHERDFLTAPYVFDRGRGDRDGRGRRRRARAAHGPDDRRRDRRRDGEDARRVACRSSRRCTTRRSA